jgi:DNA-binding transcriptional ArsR family regulator
VTTYRATAQLEALGDPTRRRIFELLVTRARPVGAIAAEMPVSRPAVSQHLKILKEVGLVKDQAHGTRRVYEADPAGVAALRDYFDRMWNDALGAFKVAAERAAKEA